MAGDPKNLFAAERTLLSWVRTAITTIGLGFVIARFNLFVRFVAHEEPISSLRGAVANGVGVAMVALGTVLCCLAVEQFRRYARSVEAGDRPPSWSLVMPVLLAWSIAAVGALLAIYLAL